VCELLQFDIECSILTLNSYANRNSSGVVGEPHVKLAIAINHSALTKQVGFNKKCVNSSNYCFHPLLFEHSNRDLIHNPRIADRKLKAFANLERLRSEGKSEVNIRLVPDALEDEDMMEMANAGLIDVMIVDDWKARLWAQILPKLKVNDKVFVREGGHVGWAIHKDRPKLAQIIRDFDSEYARKQGIYDYRLKRAMQQVKQLKDPSQSADWKRFQQTIALFRRYGERYGFDPLMLAAQGYQESQLNQNAKSQVGAIGVMQIMPATGAELKVGDIHVTEPNIHAGAKYMDILMTKYFPDAHFSEGNRPLFAFAAYNAGPGNIARMRKEAVKRGLDPDKWFNNVEVVVAEKIGIETTTYVRNIYKYYVTYKLTLEAQETRRKALDEVKKSTR